MFINNQDGNLMDPQSTHFAGKTSCIYPELESKTRSQGGKEASSSLGD